MPRIFRDQIGTTKLSLFLMSVAMLAVFCFAAVPSASAQTSISFYLNISGSTPTMTGNQPQGVLVTVTLNPDGVATDNSKKATVTFTGEDVAGTQYYLGYKTIINVNGTWQGGSPTVTATISGTSAAGTQSITNEQGSLDSMGFGATSIETNNPSVTNNDAFTSITFTLTSTVPWTSASTVLAATGGTNNVDAGAQIGTASRVNETNNTFANDTYDAGGLYTPSPTPEPTSYLLFGSGLLLLGVVSRKKLGLSV